MVLVLTERERNFLNTRRNGYTAMTRSPRLENGVDHLNMKLALL